MMSTLHPDRRSRDQRVVEGWRDEHSTYEQLLKMAPAEREAILVRLGTSYRIAFGNYQVAKAAHQRVAKGTDR